MHAGPTAHAQPPAKSTQNSSGPAHGPGTEQACQNLAKVHAKVPRTPGTIICADKRQAQAFLALRRALPPGSDTVWVTLGDGKLKLTKNPWRDRPASVATHHSSLLKPLGGTNLRPQSSSKFCEAVSADGVSTSFCRMRSSARIKLLNVLLEESSVQPPKARSSY